MTGAQAFLHVLAESGVHYLFGNPGSTELPLMDALVAESRLNYILALHEIAAVSMADGYTQASRAPGVVNVHVSCGLGNSMGMLYNAYCSGTPLILTAGQQDRRLRFGEPVLAGETVTVARPWTKWAAEVQRVDDVPAAVRRAVQTALTPPTGPVFLSLPDDVMMETIESPDLRPARVPDSQVRPPVEALERAADLLARAERPVILGGSRVMEAGAAADLTALAERIGAVVFSEMPTAPARLPIAPGHPLYAGALPFWTPDIRRRLEEFDVALVAGMDLLRLYLYHEQAPPMPGALRLIHLDCDARQIGKNYAVEVGLIGDLKAGLAELEKLVGARLTAEGAETAARRKAEMAARRRAEGRTIWEEIERQRDQRPMEGTALIGALARVLPEHAVVVDEAVTTNQNTLARLGVPRDPSGHFSHRGWALGWGLGCAMGVKLAWPERPVVALLGDGAAVYGIQGLWTAAHYRIPVVVIVCNNREYKILKMCGNVMGLPNMSAGKYVGMDLRNPEIDFAGLARSLGVEAYRVENPDEVSGRVRAALSGDKPVLLDVPVG